LTIQRLFPDYFRNFIFVSVGVIDSAKLKGVQEVEEVRDNTRESLESYVKLAGNLGFAADYRMEISTEVVDMAQKLCLDLRKDYPRLIVFAGQLVFKEERWFQRILHNETAYQLQRRLQFSGINTMILPIRVLEDRPAAHPVVIVAAEAS